MPTTSSATTLDAVRARRLGREDAELALVFTVLDWTLDHTVGNEDAATYVESYGDTGLWLAGEGAPCVSEFAAYELAAALGMSTDAGKSYLGRVLEIRYRLPRLWERVSTGQVPVWRAGRIADHTIVLSQAGARYVDDRVASFAHRVGPAQVERLVTEALVRFEPEEAARRAAVAAEDRRFDVHLRDADPTGTVEVTGVLDAADALDLEYAVLRTATQLSQLGCDESIQVRRSLAVGEIARAQHTLDLTGPGLDTPHSLALPRHSTNEDPVVGRVPARDERVYRDRTPATAGRGVTLYVHLNATDSTGIGTLEATRSPVVIEQIRSWCTRAGTKVTIKPVIDLASTSSTDERLRTDSYTPTARIAEAVRLRNRTCVFPWCPRRSDHCDLDHVIPYDAGGATSTDNLAPLCRRHHRAKTHSAWSYRVITPGTYAWTSPTGLGFTVDQSGTRPDPEP